MLRAIIAASYADAVSRLTRNEMQLYRQRLAGIMRWLARAEKRLRERDEGETAELTRQAYNAVYRLSVHCHYESCDGAGEANGRGR